MDSLNSAFETTQLNRRIGAHVQHVFADSVEHRSAEMHVARMLHRGEATEVAPGRYQTT